MASYTYNNGVNPIDYVEIAVDRKSSDVWAANIALCGSSACGDAQANTIPLGGLGGTTPIWENEEPVGIALWRPAKR